DGKKEIRLTFVGTNPCTVEPDFHRGPPLDVFDDKDDGLAGVRRRRGVLLLISAYFEMSRAGSATSGRTGCGFGILRKCWPSEQQKQQERPRHGSLRATRA